MAFLTTQGYEPSPVERELMGSIVPMRLTGAADTEGEQPTSDEDATA